MKKVFTLVLLLTTMSFSYDIKPSDISFSWTGFKNDEKIGVSGVFDKVKYTMSKKSSAKTLKKALTGTKASISAKSVNIGNNAIKYGNVYGNFLKLMKSDTIEASIYKLMEGKNIGTISLKIKMNNRVNLIPMKYIVKNNTLEAIGTMDVLDFALSKQHKIFSKNKFHGNLSWTQVDLKLNIKL